MKKKRLLALVLSICMLFSFAAVLPEGVFTDNAGITASAYLEHSEQYSNSRNFDNLSFEDAKYFYYNQLNDREKELYNQLKSEMYVGYSITVPNEENELLDRAYTTLQMDFPIYKIYYDHVLDNGRINETHHTRIVRKNPYSNNYNTEKVNAGIKQVAATIKSDDRYTTIRKLWDYSLRNSPYGYLNSTDKISRYNDSALGFFIAHFAVCAGLSDSIKIICNELEIPCIIMSNGGHAWNIIEMEDGKWYCFDCAIPADFEMAEREGIQDYLLDYLLIGFNSNEYWDGNDANQPNIHFITDPYIFHYEDLLDGRDIVVPELSYDSYVYTGNNTDFSYNIVPFKFVEWEPTFIYEVNEDGKTCTITDYYGEQKGDLIIPETINGYTVTKIGDSAFYSCTGFDGVLYLPDSLVTIESGAFFNCCNLKRVVFSDNLVEIKKLAFKCCSNLENINFPDSIIKIDDFAFSDCNKIKQIVLPQHIEYLGNEVFVNCLKLSGDIVIPDSIKYLGDAFYGCSGLDGYLYLPDDVEWHKGLLAYTKIKGIVVKQTNKRYAVYDGILYTKDRKKLIYCPTGKEGQVSFPDELEEMEEYAFFQCEKLKGDLIFPKNLKIIGGSSFQFSGFNGQIIFNEGLEYIGDAAFSMVNFVGDLIIPDTVTYIGHSAFFYCQATNCTKIKISNSIDTIHNHTFFSAIHNDEPIEELIIPERVLSIEESAFEGVHTNNVYLNSTNSIGINAFSSTEILVRDNSGYIYKSGTFHCKCNNLASIDWCKNNNKDYVLGHDYENTLCGNNEYGETIIKRTCKNCDHTHIETNHSFGEWKETTKPTCQANGEESRICIKCGAKESRVVYSIDHDYEDTIVAPTCTDYGYTLHKCSMCDDYYKDGYIGFSGHTFSEWIVTKEATCTSEGEQIRTCEKCGAIENEVIDKLGHHCEYVVIEPTCTQKGYKGYRCFICGNKVYIEDSADIEPLCHDYVETVVAPTCTTKGYTNHKCSRCGDEYNDTETDMIAHKFGDWTVTTKPTCTAKGVETRKCENCDKTETRDVDVIDHTYGDWDIKSYDRNTGESKLERKCINCTHTETKTEKDTVQRYAGSGRFATAAEISKGSFETAKTVVLAYGLNSADALAGVPLATKYNAPILLTNTKTLPQETLAEIKRLKATNVIILGGEGAIGTDVENLLKKEGLTTQRIAGKTRFGTATAIAQQLTETPEEIFFVYAFNFADALSASTVAAVKGAPIIYLKTNGDIDADTAAYLAKVRGKAKKAYVIGGTGVISDDMMNKAKNALGLDTITRAAGANRYATCIEVNNTFKDYLTGSGICVAKGLDFPDALAGGVFAALKKMPLFLVDGSLKDVQTNYLGNKDISNVYVFGGTGAVPDDLVERIAKAS